MISAINRKGDTLFTPGTEIAEIAEIAVIGGSGFYDLFDNGAERLEVSTPFGEPSDAVTVGTVAGRRVAFLPRHGHEHTLPPHRINYRANVWALASLGVRAVVAPCAVGSLRRELAPGDVVICDQLIDRTRGRRDDTYFDGPLVAHLSAPTPYCDDLGLAASNACADSGMTVHRSGTVIVIEGPRFATRAESRLHAQSGADVVNMTQYPEAVLARELGLCYAALSLITDYDAGLEDPDHPAAPVTQEGVLGVFEANVATLRSAVMLLLSRHDGIRRCDCGVSRPRPINHAAP